MSDIALSVDDAALKSVFDGIFGAARFAVDKTFGADFWFQFVAKSHIESWDFSLQPPDPFDKNYTGGYLLLKNAVVAWDELRFVANVDIPRIHLEACLGHIFGHCVGFEIDLFGHHPDLSIPLDISNILRSSITLGIRPFFELDSGEWRLHPTIVWNHFELIDVGSTVGDLIQRMADAFIHDALGFLPGWAIDVLEWIVGSLTKIVKDILDLPDNLIEWFSQLINHDIDPFDLIITIITNLFKDKITLYKIETPVKLLGASDGVPALPPVTLNISDVSFDVANDRCIIGVSL